MEEGNKSSDYAAPSPKEVRQESVDDLLANVDSFIEGVYRDLSISPPQRSRSFCTQRTVNESSISSISTPNISTVGAASLTDITFEGDAVVSPTTHRDMDAEIERIERICDDVDQNLRSIGLFMNNTTNAEGFLNLNFMSSPSATTSSLNALNINGPILSIEERYQNIQRSLSRCRRPSPLAAPNSHVIDLSESQTQTPERQRRTLNVMNNRYFNDDDDDVILVSANIHPVVDLCTPGGHQEQPNPRPTINRRELNRRRLTHQDNDASDSCCHGPTTARKRRTENVTSSVYKNPITESENVDVSPPVTSSSGPTPFMCPVCMESCLQRQPTSTRCGHVFCKECIEHAMRLSHKCPLCNSKISKSQIFRIYL